MIDLAAYCITSNRFNNNCKCIYNYTTCTFALLQQSRYVYTSCIMQNLESYDLMMILHNEYSSKW